MARRDEKEKIEEHNGGKEQIRIKGNVTGAGEKSDRKERRWRKG